MASSVVMVTENRMRFVTGCRVRENVYMFTFYANVYKITR